MIRKQTVSKRWEHNLHTDRKLNGKSSWFSHTKTELVLWRQMILIFSWSSKAFASVSHLTVSKIDSFKVFQTIIIQGLKWKTNPDSVVEKSQQRIYFPFSYNWANSICRRIWWFSSRRQSSSSTPPGVRDKRLQRIICSAERVFEHYSEEQNCFSLSISVNVH